MAELSELSTKDKQFYLECQLCPSCDSSHWKNRRTVYDYGGDSAWFASVTNPHPCDCVWHEVIKERDGQV